MLNGTIDSIILFVRYFVIITNETTCKKYLTVVKVVLSLPRFILLGSFCNRASCFINFMFYQG